MTSFYTGSGNVMASHEWYWCAELKASSFPNPTSVFLFTLLAFTTCKSFLWIPLANRIPQAKETMASHSHWVGRHASFYDLFHLLHSNTCHPPPPPPTPAPSVSHFYFYHTASVLFLGHVKHDFSSSCLYWLLPLDRKLFYLKSKLLQVWSKHFCCLPKTMISLKWQFAHPLNPTCTFPNLFPTYFIFCVYHPINYLCLLTNSLNHMKWGISIYFKHGQSSCTGNSTWQK